jgi:hypothetical protein
MFGSTVLEVGIGLIFTFLTVSLICGSVTETIATIFSWRSATLLTGINALVNDPTGNGLALQLYNTALMHPRGDGTATTTDDLKQVPSYIDPKHFAQALLDAVAAGQTTVAGIKTAIADLPDPQLKTMLTTMMTHTGESVDTLRDHVAAWFDAGMGRVSGDYKRRTQLWCFIIGLVIAAFLNIDTLHMATVLWQNPDLAKGIASPSDNTAQAALTQVRQLGLPIGWTDERILVWTSCNVKGMAVVVIGWLITAGSTLFGTSFWYDALSSVLKLRGSGPAPAAAPAPAPAPAPVPVAAGAPPTAGAG